MTLLTNNFGGGTNGTTISTVNSGGASGNAFDSVSISSTSAIIFDSTHAAHGSYSAKYTTGASGTTALTEWTTSLGTQATVYFRLYMFISAGLSPGVRFCRLQSGASHAGSLLLTNTTITLSYGSGFTGGATFSTVIPTSQWFRVEGFVTGSATTGAVSATLYLPQDSTIPVETQANTGVNTVGPLAQIWFGQANSAANSGPFWLDDVAASTTGYLGPATARTHGSIVPSLVAAGVI